MNKLINMREAIAGLPVNLRWVNRFSTSRCIRPENVAEHSYFVCFYAWLLASAASARASFTPEESSQLMRDVLEKTVLHDLEECRTGDIHRPFKYSHPQLKTALDDAAKIAVDQIKARLFCTEAIGDRLAYVWHTSKDHSLSGCIVRLADFLSVLSFVMQEGPDAPKRLCLDTMLEHWGHFWDGKEQKPRLGFELLAPELEETARMVREVFA